MWRVLMIFSIFIFIIFQLWQLFTYYQETDREFKRLNSIYGTVYIIRELFSNYWPYSIFIHLMISYFPRWDKLKPMYNIWCLSKYIILFIIIWNPLWNLIRYVPVRGTTFLKMWRVLMIFSILIFIIFRLWQLFTNNQETDADNISENVHMDQHGSVTADETMDAELDDNQETMSNVMAVDKTLASKTNESDDTVSAGESMDMDLDDNEENTPSSEVVAKEAEDLEENGGTILQSTNVPNNNGMEYSREKLVLQKSENQTFNDKKESLKTTVKWEVSLTRSNCPSKFRKEEDSKGRLAEASGMDGKSVLKNRGALLFQPTAPATDNPVSLTRVQAVQDVCKGNQGERSLTSVFSPTDDPQKFQSNQATSSDLALSYTHPFEDVQDHETTESSISKSTTTHADHKIQQARSSDQDNVCCQPSSSQEAPVELHQTKLEAQKKQKGMDADVEKEDTPSDGRPSVEHKAPVESHQTKLEAQKKQKGTDADVEKEDTPSDGRPSVEHKAPVESHQTKLEAQKKQKGTDADVEKEDTPSDGRPSVEHKAPVESHQTKLEAQKKQKGTDADVEKEDTPSDGRPSVEHKAPVESHQTKLEAQKKQKGTDADVEKEDTPSDGRPSVEHKAPVESHQTKLEAQKKQKGTDADVEKEDTPSDGRPSVEHKNVP